MPLNRKPIVINRHTRSIHERTVDYWTPERIKALRAASGMTARQFGKRLGYTGTRAAVSVYELEAGKWHPSLSAALILTRIDLETRARSGEEGTGFGSTHSPRAGDGTVTDCGRPVLEGTEIATEHERVTCRICQKILAARERQIHETPPA